MNNMAKRFREEMEREEKPVSSIKELEASMGDAGDVPKEALNALIQIIGPLIIGPRAMKLINGVDKIIAESKELGLTKAETSRRVEAFLVKFQEESA